MVLPTEKTFPTTLTLTMSHSSEIFHVSADSRLFPARFKVYGLSDEARKSHSQSDTAK